MASATVTPVKLIDVYSAVLERVTVLNGAAVPSATLSKARLAGLTAATGVFPTRLTVWVGKPLLVKVKTATRTPVVVGLKVTLIVQVAPRASVPPQLVAGDVVAVNSAALLPVFVMVMEVSEASPVFLRVKVWTALVVPGA